MSLLPIVCPSYWSQNEFSRQFCDAWRMLSSFAGDVAFGKNSLAKPIVYDSGDYEMRYE